jgi:hypothetical protein
MWKSNGKTTTLQLFLDSLSEKTPSLEEAMDLSRDRNEMMRIWTIARALVNTVTTLRVTSNAGKFSSS